MVAVDSWFGCQVCRECAAGAVPAGQPDHRACMCMQENTVLVKLVVSNTLGRAALGAALAGREAQLDIID